MVAINFSRLAALVSALVCVTRVTAAPRHELVAKPKPAFVASAPHFTVYSDKWISGETGPPDVSQITGYNVFALSFWLLGGPADQAQEWVTLTSAQQASIKSTYNNAGISLVVSAFGSTDTPSSSGVDPTTTANNLATWVKANNLDGVDIDYEDLAAFNKGDGSAENWLITFTQVLRAALPSGQYIISSAPLAPWFQPGGRWGGGGMLKVDQSVGSLIDFYNVQFYNQGTTEYTDCNGLLTASSSAWPDTALFQIAASGVDQNKLVIGKPANTGDASNGYMDAGTLATCVSQAAGQGWQGGVMVWEFPDAASAWIEQVRGSTFPISGSSGPTPTSTSTSTSPTSTPPSSGGCSGVAAWSSGTAYPGGSTVTYNGDLWTAKWWSEGDAPGGSADDWTNTASC